MHTAEPSGYTARMRVAFHTVVLGFAAVLGLGGCGAPLVVDETVSPDITAEELSLHTHYLAHPKLEGRKVRTAGSAMARRYIADRFAAMGLKPWSDATGYEQPYHIGTNVVGVLPGSDPVLADEYVVVCAHYDHLGKGLLWTYRGAADNAAGVAVLLEVAEHMVNHPPRRTVVFASWDGEERGLWGSAAFTRSARYEPGKLAGVVNLDMLGRKAFDAVDNTLIAVGGSGYAGLRRAVVEAGEGAGIRVLPMHRMLVGPRSDHVAFEAAGRPWVFFTCGPYLDYHGGGDTPDKLDYEKMTRSAEVVRRVAAGLADAPAIETAQPADGVDRVTLGSVEWLLSEVVANYRDAHLNRGQAKKLAAVRDRLAEAVGNEAMTLTEQNALLEQTLDELAPLIVGGKLNDDQRIALLGQLDLYLHHPSYFVAGQKAFLAVAEEHKGFPKTETDLGAFRWHEVNGTSVKLAAGDDGRLRLSAHVPYAYGRYTFYPPNRLVGGLTATYHSFDVVGTRDEVMAQLVLKWAKHAHTPALKIDPDLYRDVARFVDPGVGPFDTETWWLALPGVSDLSSAEKRLTAWVRGENGALAELGIGALRYLHDEASGLVYTTIVNDTSLPPARRARTMTLIKDADDLDAMAALVNAADDERIAVRRVGAPYRDETWPFYDRYQARMRRELDAKQKYRVQVAEQTVGWHAIQRLQWLTGDRRRDTPQQWRDWLNEKRAGE